MLVLVWIILGLLMGSVIAWLAVTLPKPYLDKGEQVTFAPVQLVPVLGWRGGTPRWLPVVQIATALVFGVLAWRIDAFAQGLHVRDPFSLLLVAGFYAAILGLILVTDYLYRLILTVVTLPATLLALLISLVIPDFYWLRAVAGAAVYGMIFAVLYLLARFLYRKRGIVPFGMGDVRLAMFIGMALGLPAASLAIVSGVILAGFGGLAIILLTGSARGVMPYGVPLCIAALAVLLAAPQLMITPY